MLHNTVGGYFDAPWVVAVVQQQHPRRDESARDSPARSGAAVHTAIPFRVRSTRPAIGSDHDRPDIAAKTLGRTRRDRETGRCRPHTDVRYSTRLPHAF